MIIHAKVVWEVPVTINVDLDDKKQADVVEIQTLLFMKAASEVVHAQPFIKGCVELPYVNNEHE